MTRALMIWEGMIGLIQWIRMKSALRYVMSCHVCIIHGKARYGYLKNNARKYGNWEWDDIWRIFVWEGKQREHAYEKHEIPIQERKSYMNEDGMEVAAYEAYG